MNNTANKRSVSLPRLAFPGARFWWLLSAVLLGLWLVLAVKLGYLLKGRDDIPKVRFPAPQAQASSLGFGLFPEAETAGLNLTDDLSEANLSARLMGVVRTASAAYASLAIGGKKEKIYRVGDALAPDVTVEAIEPTRVVVRERGVLRRISLASRLDNTPLIEEDQSAPREESLLPALAKGAGALLASPEFGDSGMTGLRIERLDPALEELDVVRTGDLVVAVDGVALGALMADARAQQELVDRDLLTLTLVRNGQETSADLDGELIRALLKR